MNVDRSTWPLHDRMKLYELIINNGLKKNPEMASVSFVGQICILDRFNNLFIPTSLDFALNTSPLFEM